MRLFPVAYGIGYVAGVALAWARAKAGGTALRDEAAETPLRAGLLAAAIYSVALSLGLAGLL